MSEDLRKKNLRKPISKTELERRWKSVRQAMEKEKLDSLVIENMGIYQGGAFRYFTDLQAVGFGSSVIFPLEQDMTIINHGSWYTPSIPEWAVFGNTKRVSLPYVPAFNFTDHMAPGAAVEAIKQAKAKTVGIVETTIMSANYYKRLEQGLPGVVFKDATDLVDEIRAVKSQEEIDLMQKTALLQDKAMYATLSLVRPGVREYEVFSEVRRICLEHGSEEQSISIGSAPFGKPAGIKGPFFQNRTLQDGDYMTVMIETNGAGGLWTEIMRTICIGDAPKALLKAWDDAVLVQKENNKIFKPGANAKDLWDKNNQILTELGYFPEERFGCHGQGYDIVERPGIRPEETMLLSENNVMALHPMLGTKEVFVSCCDNFLISAKGNVKMHKCPQEVFVV